MAACTRRTSALSLPSRTCARSWPRDVASNSATTGAAASRRPRKQPGRRFYFMDLNSLISILLGGMAAGMVLFVVSVGLSVTMGLMGFVNLAHGGFAMLGGYAIVLSMRHWGLPFPAALAFGFFAIAGISVVFERLLYAPLYRATELDQV